MKNSYETCMEEIREAKRRVYADFLKSGEKDLKKFLKNETANLGILYRKKETSA